MARLRTIKPELYTNDVLAQCSIHARYLFPGLWCHADRRGILEDRPARIKAAIYPYDTVDVDELLSELSNAGFIKRYEAEGVRCIQIVNFLKHQYPNQKEKDNGLPQPSAQCQHSARTGNNDTGTTPGTVPAPTIFVSGELVSGVLVNDPDTPVSEQPSRRKKSARRMIPDDWYPDEKGIRYALDQGMTIRTVRREVDEMIDWHKRNAKDSADHAASWRTWCRNFKKFGKQNEFEMLPNGAWAYPDTETYVDEDA